MHQGVLNETRDFVEILLIAPICSGLFLSDCNFVVVVYLVGNSGLATIV